MENVPVVLWFNDTTGLYEMVHVKTGLTIPNTIHTQHYATLGILPILNRAEIRRLVNGVS